MGTQARVRSREIRRAKELAERRRRRLFGGAGVIIVGLLVAIVVSVVYAAGGSGTSSDSADATPTGPIVAPANASGGALVVGAATAPVRVEVFLDYMCPYCGRFEQANGTELDRLVADGTVRLELHPLSFLDRMSNGTRYSTRTANAAATVADRAPDKLLAFNRALYANQPKENTAGLSDQDITALATSAGVPAEVTRDFHELRFERWVTTSTDAAMGSGVNSTPTVRVNGKQFTGDLFTVGPLTAAITAAKG